MIREATERDAEAITKIYNHYILKTVTTFEEAEVTVGDFRERINDIQQSGFSWLVAIENEQVIGFAYSSKWNNRAAYRKTAEVSVYISHTSKFKGWGTKLYEVLFSSLHGKDVHIVIGGITLPNPASVAIHEKFGMEKVAHFKEVGYKFGEWLDVGYWQLQLNSPLIHH